VLRRNPSRAEEIKRAREDKYRALRQAVDEQNRYLHEHPRATLEVARRRIERKSQKLKTDKWVVVSSQERAIALSKDNEKLQEVAKLDGCYVLRTDLSPAAASKELVHVRYKDLGLVEWAFRTSKTVQLEMRPIHVRLADRTRGHAFVVMLAYRIIKELASCWRSIDLTVQEALQELDALCVTEVSIAGKGAYHRIPEPRELSSQLLEAAKVKLPTFLPSKGIKVATKKKLTSRRKAA